MSDQKQPKRKIGLKLNNDKSSVQLPDRIAHANNLDEQANDALNKRTEYNERAMELSVKFKSFVQDKTLKANKTPILEGIEQETINKLVELATEMNQDEYQPEGIGSNALCLILMKFMLVQRDIINDLSYELYKFKSDDIKK